MISTLISNIKHGKNYLQNVFFNLHIEDLNKIYINLIHVTDSTGKPL